MGGGLGERVTEGFSLSLQTEDETEEVLGNAGHLEDRGGCARPGRAQGAFRSSPHFPPPPP